jgi:hypothetical protein
MKAIGKVNVPQEAFMAVLKIWFYIIIEFNKINSIIILWFA